jgi:hypothetical protein
MIISAPIGTLKTILFITTTKLVQLGQINLVKED